MKKLICILLALLLIGTMTVTAHAATPTLQIPKVPQISKIKIEAKLDEQVYENAVQKWFADHPIKLDISRAKLPPLGD